MKCITGKLLDYDTFCQLHEDVLEWLLESEDKLKSMDSVSDNLDVARNQFEDNSEYMTELGMFSHKMSLITIFGHKHKIKNFIKKFDIFHEKISMAFGFWSIFGIKFLILKQK